MKISDTRLRKEVTIVNTVSTAELKQDVAIESFNEYEHLESNLALYLCGYVKDQTMVGRVTIFGNGKMISVGTKSPEQSFKELRRAMKLLREYGLAKGKRLSPLVRNIVAKTDFQKPLDIEKLARRLPKSLYEPEQFPGIIYRIRGSVVSLIFASGKCVIVGSKSYEDLNSAYFDVRESCHIEY